MPEPPHDDAAGVPEWMVTFSDMMSLLLCFFVMLVAMSEIKEEERIRVMIEALRRRFGPADSVVSLIPGPAPPMNSAIRDLASMGRARRVDIMRGGDRVKAPVGDYPRVRTLRQATHDTVGGVVFFAEGSAELSDENRRALELAARQIGGKPQKIEIRGHTSSRPLPEGSPYSDHWSLAYARCLASMEYLVKLGIDRRRIRLSVAGNNEPRHTGSDPLLLKENARVEIYLLDELVAEGASTQREGTGVQ